MDTGVLGFLVMLAVFAAAGVWFARRERRLARSIRLRGYVETTEVPADLLERIGGTVGRPCPPVRVRSGRGGSNATWLIQASDDDGEASTAMAVLALPVPDTGEGDPFIATSYAGAAPSGWLGRVGLRLTELGRPELSELSRLTDEQGLLSGDSPGFVVWAYADGDVADVVPANVVEYLQRQSDFLQGFAVMDGYAMAWATWGRAVSLVDGRGGLARAVRVAG